MARTDKFGIKQKPMFIYLPEDLNQRFETQRKRLFATKAAAMRMAVVKWVESQEKKGA